MKTPTITIIPLMLSVLGCREVLAPESAALTGRWRSETELLQPRGSMERLFIVFEDGAAENHVITRGVYSNESNRLSSTSVLYGLITGGSDKFIITPDSLVTHDEFYGPNHRHVQLNFNGWPRDSTRYVIEGDRLTLEYYTYPADAPVLTRSVLFRVK